MASVLSNRAEKADELHADDGRNAEAAALRIAFWSLAMSSVAMSSQGDVTFHARHGLLNLHVTL